MLNKIGSLEGIVQVLQVFKKAVPTDLSIAICDLEKFIAYMPGTEIDLSIKVGQSLHPEEPLSQALKKNIRLEAEVPADFYGFEFIGTATPLHDENGRVIGGIAVQVRKANELVQISGAISSALNHANEQIASIANGALTLTGASETLMQQSNQAEKSVQSTAEILTMMKRMADQTNLLGLNAAIEAARAGESGKGFNVVATEIRRFSKETIDSTGQIRETMVQIFDATKKMATSISQISDVGQLQAQSIQQVSDFIKEIQEMSTKLNGFAEKL